MILTRDALLKETPRVFKEIEIDGLGTVRIQKLRFSEATLWRKNHRDDGLNELRLVAMCLVDERGEVLLSTDDAESLANKGSDHIAELIYHVMVINGFMDEVEVDNAAADLESIPDRLFLCRLADRWNIPDVDTLGDSLSTEQIAEWKAVALYDRWFEDRQWRKEMEYLVEEFEPPIRPKAFMTPEESLNHYFPKVG